MEGKNRFSGPLREAVNACNLDGRHIVETSRLILLENYSDEEYNEEFFSTFNLIIDEHRDGVSYEDIEKLYKHSFVDSLANFRRCFSL